MFSLSGTSVTTGDVHPGTPATGDERGRRVDAAGQHHGDIDPGRREFVVQCFAEARDIEFAGLRHATDTGTACFRSKWEQFLTKGCS